MSEFQQMTYKIQIFRNNVSILSLPSQGRDQERIFQYEIHYFCKSSKSSPDLSFDKGEVKKDHFLKIAMFKLGM